MHGGLDGYKRVLDDPTVDIVLLTAAPGFRPSHVRAAVEAGKHVFAEKPSCVDPAGYRTCLAAHDLAVAKGTAIVTGTQYRRQANYSGAVEQIRQGAIGDVISATTRYCSGGIWYRVRKEGMSDAQYQLTNWMHFIWLSGDQIVEQAVHNIDAINWVMDANPVSAFGSGGRFTRPDDSEMWDNVSVDYEYPGNRIVSFMCRQIPGAAGDNGSIIYGSKGTCHIGAMSSGSKIFDRSGTKVWEMSGSISEAYKQEHKDLVDSIRAGRPIVELRQTADSSMTAVLGRVAAYTGQKVAWDFLATKSELDLFPKNLSWDGSLPPPHYAIPGKTKLI
jgi:predicted dehydrogenase